MHISSNILVHCISNDIAHCSPTSCRLEFGTTPATEPGAPPTITNDILAMISPEKENVVLQKVQ